MKRKRSARTARADASKGRLREKMTWLLYGANGGFEMPYLGTNPDERWLFPAEVGLDVFGRWLGAIQAHLTFVSDEQRAFIAKPRTLEKYDDFDAAVDFLHELGVRA